MSAALTAVMCANSSYTITGGLLHFQKAILDKSDQKFIISHPDSDGLRREFDEIQYHNISLKVVSYPEGATVFYRGTQIGIAPITIRDDYTMQKFHGKEIHLESIFAQWKSGASTVITNPIIMTRDLFPELLVNRPSSFPGLEIDNDTALQIAWDRHHARNPPTLSLSIKSDPSGATIYQEGQSCGISPIIIQHTITYDEYKAKEIFLKKISARWVSGAEKSEDRIKFNWTGQANDQFTFIRPAKAERVDLDVNFAVEQQRLLAEKKRIEQDQENQRKALELQQQQYETALAEERARQAQILARQEEAQRRQNNIMLMGIMQQNLQQQQLYEQQQQQQRLQMLQQLQPQFRSGSGTIIGPNMQNYQYWWYGR